jgi:hypothetical protein
VCWIWGSHSGDYEKHHPGCEEQPLLLCWHELLFSPENGSIFLRNVDELIPDYNGITHDWPLLHYLGNFIDCCSVERCWLLNTKERRNPSDRYSHIHQNRHFAFGPLVRAPLFSWRYCICSFIYGDGLHKLTKFNQSRYGGFWENRHVIFLGPIWRAPVLGAGMFAFTGHGPVTDILMNTKYA